FVGSAFQAMNKFFFLGITLLLFNGCNSPQKDDVYGDGTQINDFKSLKQQFFDPPADFRPVVDWGWNCEITEEKIDYQLEQFHNQRFGGVFIHPHPGMITEYLSEEYFNRIAYAIKKAEELGMTAWISDDYYSQSGHAGGLVQTAMPESYNQGKGLKLIRKEYIDPTDKSWIYIALEKKGNSFIDITGSLPDNFNREGDYYLFEKTYDKANNGYGGYPYPDLLVPGVTEKFISLTMEGYESEIGNQFGKTMRGVFADEPHIAGQKGSNDIRWTPTLFRDFQKKWDYDLRLHLPALFEKTENYREVRHNYHQLLMELFAERWAKPWLQYTEKKGLKSVGHYYEHEWPDPRKTGGDNMYLHVWNQLPGIDYLGDQYNNVLLGRQLESIANQFNKSRAVCQSYPASGWDIDFEEIKRLGDYEYGLGANFMNQFSAFMTLQGARKREWPVSFSWHNPWWRYYHKVIDYFGRLSLALSSGKQVNKILILEPTSSVWMHFSPLMKNNNSGTFAEPEQIENNFKQFIHDLEVRQVEYDLGSELVLRDFGGVEGGRLKMGLRTYDLVILGPGMENVNKPTADHLEKYLQNGGRVISFELPQYSSGKPTDRFDKLFSKYKNYWKGFDDWKNQDFYNLVADNSLDVTSENPLPENLYHHRRIMKDGQVIFWQNFNVDKEVNLKFRMKGKSVSLLNLEDGTIYNYPANNEGGYMNIELELLPGQSKLFYIHQNIEKSGKPYPDEKTFRQLVTGKVKEIKRERPNVLVLDYCDLKLKDEVYESIYYIDAADLIFKKHGFEKSRIDHNPWNFVIQYKTEILDKADFPEGSGFEAEFSFRTKANFKPDRLQLAIELGSLYKVAVNGQDVKPVENEWWLDRSLNVYDISEVVKPGRNTILLKLHPMHIHAELERIFVMGDFGLIPSDNGFVMDETRELTLGSWREQAMPFYFSEVSYVKEFHLEQKGTSYKLQLDQWNGTVAAVAVNGKEAGIIGWKPCELDITEHLKPGSNKVEVRICGSLKNLLGPHYFTENQVMVTPWSFNAAPENQPSGEKYDLLDYGLFNDFQIMTAPASK
ncbi:MAG: glycosyl hydrolase, partial [Bacteroidota bacterium]